MWGKGGIDIFAVRVSDSFWCGQLIGVCVGGGGS